MMRRPATAVTGDHGVNICRDVLGKQLGWIFHELDQRDDYGIDAWVQIVGSNIADDHVTGRMIAIKAGDSWFEGKETVDGWRFNANLAHLDYWLGYSMPVLVVIVSPDGTAYWQHVNNDTVDEFERGFRLDIPRTNTLGSASKDAITALAWTSVGLIESLPANHALLPPDTVRPLRRAESVDRLATARLADRLAQGRGAPHLTVSGLLAMNPSWLADSPAAQSLWMAVAGYNHEHDLPGTVAHQAHTRAADAGGDNTARAQAFAGLSLLFTDDADKARARLEAARDGGQVLLADFGLAVLDVPRDSAPAIDVPESIATASQAELDAEPTVLNFLAENAKRHGNLDECIELRRRAHASSHPGSRIQLELARDLNMRAIREGRHAGRDAREALALAQSVAIERRRWSGPSAEAVAVSTQVLLLTDEPEQAIAESTSNINGGKAEPHEAAERMVVRAGAFAALSIGNDEALDRYLAVLEDDDVVARQLRALRAELEHGRAPAPATIPTWEQIAADAAETDDREIVAVAVAHLAHLGVWSPQADALIDKHLLPEPEQKVLRAVWETHHDRNDGLAQLRALAQDNPNAAAELILALDENPNEALAESSVQMQRWHTWTLAEKHIQLLREISDDAGAQELARACIDDGAFTIGARQSAARWLVRYHARAGRLPEAAGAALAGLGLSDDEDGLAWMYVAVLTDDGDLAGARHAVARYGLTPVTDREADLWIKLHVGRDDITPDVRVLLDIIERTPRGRFRNWVRALALHESLTPTGPASGLPADVTDAIRALAAEAGVDPENPALTLPTTPPAPPDPHEYQKLRASARLGRTPLADIAAWCDRPYTSALLDSPSAVLAAADSGDALRQFGRHTACAALTEPVWTVDLSTLTLLSHLDRADVEAMLAQVPARNITASASGDIADALEELRGLPAAYRLNNSSGGIVTGARIDPRRVAELQRHTQRMNELSATMTIAPAPSPGTGTVTVDAPGPLAEAIETAVTAGTPLWCDDVAARQRARGRGLVCFGTVDVLETPAPRTLREQLLALARASVIDLPLTADELTVLAGEREWASGPAHTALASAGTWDNAGQTWRALWRTIAVTAAAEGVDPLTLATQAALTGTLNYVPPEQALHQYRELVVIALVACHAAGTVPEALPQPGRRAVQRRRHTRTHVRPSGADQRFDRRRRAGRAAGRLRAAGYRIHAVAQNNLPAPRLVAAAGARMAFRLARP